MIGCVLEISSTSSLWSVISSQAMRVSFKFRDAYPSVTPTLSQPELKVRLFGTGHFSRAWARQRAAALWTGRKCTNTHSIQLVHYQHKQRFDYSTIEWEMVETHWDGLHADPEKSFHSSLSILIRPPWTTKLNRSRPRASVWGELTLRTARAHTRPHNLPSSVLWIWTFSG